MVGKNGQSRFHILLEPAWEEDFIYFGPKNANITAGINEF
jgi:hypothetical protein